MTINRARKILGKSSNKFSDEEIDRLINQFSYIAETVSQIIVSKQTTRGVEVDGRKEDYVKGS